MLKRIRKDAEMQEGCTIIIQSTSFTRRLLNRKRRRLKIHVAKHNSHARPLTTVDVVAIPRQRMTVEHTGAKASFL